MPTKISPDSFLTIVRQSGLVEEGQLKRFWQAFEQAGKNKDVDLIAGELASSNLLSKWQIDKLLQGKHKGFFLGKYKLISLLGSGGMSAVYLAEHTLMRRRVAIKVLPQSRIEDSSYLERFHREAQAVASLDHPNIMRAYDVDQEGKVHFLVMEYIEGQNFLELVAQQGPLNFVRCAEYIRQAAEGLSHAHEAGMIHRDIKPGNLLVDKRGVVKILDMGLAMFFDPTGKDDVQSSLTIQHDERVLGTADYLSPEQALNSHAVDVRTDIYSLGCTFYYILTGHPPFPEGSLAQRLLFHQTKQPSPVERDRPDISPALAAILRKMMEKKQIDRYQTARDVQEDLSKWLLLYGDAEWRERNAMLVAAVSSGSDIFGKNATSPPVATIVPPLARPVGPQPAPVSPPLATAPPIPVAAPVAVPVAQVVPPTSVAAPPVAAPIVAPEAQSIAPPPAALIAPVETSVSEAKAATPVTPQSIPFQVTPPHAASSPPRRSLPTPEIADSPFGDVQPDIAPPGFAQSALAATPGVSTTSAEFGGFDPSEFSALREPSATAKTSSSSSTIKQGGRTRFNPEQITELLKNKNGKWILGGAGLGVVLLIFLVSYMMSDGTQRRPGSKSREKVNEYVVGGKGKYKTIAAALESLKVAGFPKTSIRVTGNKRYADRLDLNGLPAGVTIFAEDPGGPTLAADGPDPLLEISNVRGLKIEGFNLDADGKETGISLKGKLPQVGIYGCYLSGFSKRGIVLEGAQGTTNDRVRIENVQLKSSDPGAVAIVFAKGASNPAHVSVDGCRLLGPMATGILIQANCDSIHLERNILAEVGIGIRVTGESRVLKEFGVANTSFFKLKQGIVFSNMPSKSSEKLGFFNNLFAQIDGAELVVEKGYDATDFAGLLDYQTGRNWTDKPMADPAVLIFQTEGRADVKYLFQSLAPDQPGFLAPSPASPQNEASPGGLGQGYVGAIPPR